MPLIAFMLRVGAWPGVHSMPAASAMTGDQIPLPHCWKEDPPTQFHRPSGLQALPAVWAPLEEPVVAPEVPVLPVDPELALAVAVEVPTGDVLATLAKVVGVVAWTAWELLGAWVAWTASALLEAPPAGTVMKTPPGREAEPLAALVVEA